jgi:mono/diheme cytochrome c family protein
MDELLQKAAEKIGMPPVLAERSAQARAEKEGTTVEAVLREWAGETDDTPDVAPAQETTPPAPAAEVPAESEPAQGATGPTEITTDYLVSLAAEAKRMPPKLVRSSAEARAHNSKSDLDEVLAGWAGVDLDGLRAQAAAGTVPVPSSTPGQSAPSTEDAATQPTPSRDVSDATDQPVPPADDAPPPAATAAAGATMSMDELLDKVAEAKGMPPALAKRSAEARAKKTGEPLEAVLAEWAGVDVSAVSVGDVPPSPVPAAAPTETSTAAPAAAGATMSMDELLDKVAEAKGMPPALAKRSAEARAKKTGEPLEAVLAEWAGVDVASVAEAGTATAAATTSQATIPAVAAGGEAVDYPDDVEVIEAKGADPGQTTGSTEEAEPVRTSGYPTWLAAAFVLIPILAVVYILVSPNGPDCGVAGQLRVDEATGLAVNCDGSDYGSSSVDFLAMGAGIYSQCAACHGSDGGGGVGPAFSGGAVLATFPSGSCSDHVNWVTLGTANFPEATYGATGKPVGSVGVMPGYEASLTPEEIAAVAIYERVQFGGQPLEEAEIDCGLVVSEGEETTEAAG